MAPPSVRLSDWIWIRVLHLSFLCKRQCIAYSLKHILIILQTKKTAPVKSNAVFIKPPGYTTSPGIKLGLWW